MTIKENIQEAIKGAMKTRDTLRLECLRMAKGALIVQEKASAKEPQEADVIAALRAEVRKRQQSVELFRELGKEEDATGAEQEIEIIEEFLPRQLSEQDLEEKVRAYLAEHPDINHPGKLTGALKKELGDSADGKLLNEICRKALDSTKSP